MKLKNSLLLSSFFCIASAQASSLYWDGGSTDLAGNGDGASLGGVGTWDTTIKNWDAGAVPYVAWDNITNANDTAYFAGTAGTVTVGSDLVVGSLVFNSNGYSFAGGNHNLTINGVNGVGMGPGSFGKTGTTVSGFNTITLGSSQKWDSWNNIYVVDLAVSGGTVDTAGYTLTLGRGTSAFTTVTSVITGSGNIVVYANGGLTSGTGSLGNANTYTGTTTINGYVQVASLQNVGTAWAFGKSTASSSNIAFNNGGFQLNGNSSTDHGMTFTGNSGIYAKQRVGTFNGQISGSGTLTIRGDYTGADGGNGTVVLAAANDYSGTISAGQDSTLRLAHINAIAQATLDTTGTRNLIDLTTNNLAYVIGGLKGSRNLNLGTGLGNGGAGAVSFGNNNSSNTYSGILSGAANFAKIGTGTQTLTANSTYTGLISVNAGILKLGAPGLGTDTPLGTAAAGTVVAATGAALDLNGYTLATDEPLTLNGTGIAEAGALMNSSLNAATYSGLITLGSASSIVAQNSNLTLSHTGTITGSGMDLTLDGEYLGTIASAIGTGTGSVIKNGPGAWVLSGINTYTGDTIVNDGELLLATGGSLNFAVSDASATQVTDVGTGTVTLGGAFTIDTSAVSVSTGSWTLVDLTNTAYVDAFTEDFSVTGFTPDGDGVTWTFTGGGKIWTFSETDGSLTVAPSGTPVDTPYDNWVTTTGLAAGVRALGLDPDKDGVKNILEFALGGNPLDGADNGVVVSKIQDVSGVPTLILTIATRAGTNFPAGSGARNANNAAQGVKYRVEGGQDLVSWPSDIVEITPAITDDLPTAPAGYEYHTFKVAGPVSGTPADFMRVMVTD